jgi:hypothetical protein
MFLSVSFVFRSMLQVLYPDVTKVDWVLHMLQCDPPAAAAGRGAYATWGQVGRRRRVGSGGMRSAGAGTGCRHRRPSRRPDASTAEYMNHGCRSEFCRRES